jgi:hypothetical protein
MGVRRCITDKREVKVPELARGNLAWLHGDLQDVWKGGSANRRVGCESSESKVQYIKFGQTARPV